MTDPAEPTPIDQPSQIDQPSRIDQPSPQEQQPQAKRRALVPVIAVAVVVVLVVAGAAVLVGRGSGTKSDPRSATVSYYGALIAHRSTPAFDLLCAARQQAMGLEDYAHAYADDVSTGTGVHTWTPGQVTVQGTNAAVPGTLVLDDKESVPITVLVVRENGSWRVCSSDLGGVIPNPGSAPAGGGITT